MNCDLVDTTSGCKCTQCGREYIGTRAGETLAQCGVRVKRERTSVPTGMGDKLEAILKSVGITEDKYKEAKKLFGLPPTCNCGKRKEWLNRVGEWWESNKGG